ncbi:zinc/iron-chelating domain protein [Perilla frutescens var. hirtella]|uniref:Zinc/iron-chelating domain protein n=1 Tax=Perilla frutescens var. hirtella TaxID=608512 RepID=A0AAD4IN24_PERFH|nr:zinc/iron-chelating domain protein [Perilla frutescens var. hirtella]KAH6797740.1 zinc/iron-chelating domain protein [Perilla frutescens var. hirtella]KAH6807325.1 zinc/iron-chelating domain protein [Perilla frutescens var. frutescens]
MAQYPPCFAAVRAAANKRPPSKQPRKSQRQKPATTTSHGFGGEKKSPVWQCVENCGACCKLDKGPNFPSAEEIFDDPSDIEMYNSLVGEDGWCINYDKSSRKCSIYADRPYFCRVEPEIFDALYGIDKKSFNKEACSGTTNTGLDFRCCADTIKAVYGTTSEELEKFNHAIWSSSSK